MIRELGNLVCVHATGNVHDHPFQSPVRELYQFVVLSNLLGNMEQNMNLERADTLKEEANECFKSNQFNYQEYSAIYLQTIFRLFRAQLRQSHNPLLQCH